MWSQNRQKNRQKPTKTDKFVGFPKYFCRFLQARKNRQNADKNRRKPTKGRCRFTSQLLAPQKAFEDAREYKLSKNTLAPLAEKQIENVLEALKDEKADPIRLEFSDSYFNIPLHPRIDSLKNLPLLYFQLFSIETLKASALKRELARKRL